MSRHSGTERIGGIKIDRTCYRSLSRTSMPVSSVVLITGGSGTIGGHLTRQLLSAGYSVRHLSRNEGLEGRVRRFHWDPSSGRIDPSCLHGVDHIVHLAGAGIADRRWRPERVHELIESRAGSARLLLRTAKAAGIVPQSFISAAGSGYYGATTSDRIFAEEDGPGSDVLAGISEEWERAVAEWENTCRVVRLRTPLVLAADGGALPLMAKIVRWWLAAPLGSGRQWMPWVHIDDLTQAYQLALDDKRWQGPVNVCSPQHVDNRTFMRTLSTMLHKPFFLPPVPEMVMHLLLGERAKLVVAGSRLSNARSTSLGAVYAHTDLGKALRDLVDQGL
ncbi:MAG: TIGR01777 family oxidoreductase [Flavobacteriales bacterium]|nr:TIGR01777 family oxidoreductase [Flavobacteriales bacterium]